MEYTTYQSNNNYIPFGQPGTTTFKIANLQVAIRPVWEYRADKFWNSFSANEHHSMPMAYAETFYRIEEYEWI